MDIKEYREHTVLFVDDEVKTLKYFSRLFSDEFNILTASSVSEAEEILRNKPDIAVLVTDQRMPVSTGLELLKKLRRDKPEIVRILTTAFVDTHTALDAINEGEVFRYIPKPWNIDELYSSLVSAMELYLAHAKIKQRFMALPRKSGDSAQQGRHVYALHNVLNNIHEAIGDLRLQLDKLSARDNLFTPVGGLTSRTLFQLIESIEHEINQVRIMINVIFNNSSELDINMENLNISSMAMQLNETVGLYKDSMMENNPSLPDKSSFIFLSSNIVFYYIIFNFLKNSLYAIASSEDGRIEIDLRPEETLNHIHIRDYGLGITSEILPNLFDEFSLQIPHRSSDSALAFRNILTSFGGDILCMHDDGKDCEYILSFPRFQNLS